MTKSLNQEKNNIIEGPILRQLLIFFFPILLGTFFQQLYNTADAVIVGKLVGPFALGAVGGTTGTLINLLVGFFVGLSSGAAVIISQYYGGKKETELSQSVHTAIALAIAGGILLMVIGITLTPTIMVAMGTPDEILAYSISYIRIYFAGVIPNLVYNLGSGILRAIGDSRRPLIYLSVSCIANILLDLLFVGILHLDVNGAAIATILSQLLSSILVLRALMKTTEAYRLIPKQIRFTPVILKRIFYIGFPAGVQSMMYSISNVIIQSFVNDFGPNTIAAWTAYSKIDALFWMIIGALGVSVATFIGQNYGARKKDRVHKCVRIGLILAFAISVVLSILLYFTGKYLLCLFTNENAVILIGMEMVRFLVPTFFTYVAIEILSSTLRGMGVSILPMIISCLGICALRIIWLYSAVPHKPVLKTVMFSYPLTWTVTSILFIIYYMYKKKRIQY